MMFTPARVKRLRKKMGLTQEQFAPLVYKHPMTVSRWERGFSPVEPPEAKLMEQLEAAAEGPVQGQSRRKAGR
jgi:DNA-binding transcriptional regulator YiaG